MWFWSQFLLHLQNCCCYVSWWWCCCCCYCSMLFDLLYWPLSRMLWNNRFQWSCFQILVRAALAGALGHEVATCQRMWAILRFEKAPGLETRDIRKRNILKDRMFESPILYNEGFDLKGLENGYPRSWLCYKLSRGAKYQVQSQATITWNATKEYLNHRGTNFKIRVLRVCFRAPFPPSLFPSFFPLFPLQALSPLLPLFPSSPPLYPPVFDSRINLT